MPLLVGVTALAVSVGGAVSAADADLVGQVTASGNNASAAGSVGTTAGGTLIGRDDTVVSRDSRRDAQADAAGETLVKLTEEQAAERDAALAKFAQAADKQAAKNKENRWGLPLAHYSLTARFGQYGLWASYHTGLDFNGDTGDSIMSIARGVVTQTGYDGSYGNKTVVTLEDGTEIWYCHQTSIYASVGDIVNAGEVIGTVGATGHVTGSHLHLEVRPDGGDPVDPYAALVEHGVQP